MPKLLDKFVSVIIILNQESSGVVKYIKTVHRTLSSNYSDYEIIIINNFSRPKEISKVTDLLVSIPSIRIVKLSKLYKHDTAVFAGLEAAIGDYTCILDTALDPVSALVKIVDMNTEADIVQGISRLPINSGTGGRAGRAVFYWYNKKYMGIDIPLDATYLISLNRKAVNALTGTNRNHRHIRHLIKQIGFRVKYHKYTPLKQPDSHRSLRTSAIEAIEIASSYSTHPLRFVTWLGIIAGTANGIYALYVVGANLVLKNVAEGWTTLSLQISSMFFVLFMILVVLSEYIGRILAESRQEQRYIISEELVSNVSLAGKDKRNVSNR